MELRDWEKLVHLLNVPSCTTSNVNPDKRFIDETRCDLLFELSSAKREHGSTTTEKSTTCLVIDLGLTFVEAFQAILMVIASTERLEEAMVEKLD